MDAKIKLLSMTDFVLEQEKEFNCQNTKGRECELQKRYNNIFHYANFLKQPLELWMFVPCAENGNVLEYDNEMPIWVKIQYQQAKERCLFEGFWIDETYKKETRQLPYLTNGKISVFLHSDFAIRHQFIEDLADAEIQLTQTAIKQLEL